jgi:hypothetical protein
VLSRNVPAEDIERVSTMTGVGCRVPGLLVLAETAPGSSTSSASSVEVCRDARGNVLAYCSMTDDTLCVDLPDLGSFYYDYGEEDVRAVPRAHFNHELLLDTYHHCVLPLILPALGTSVLHASAVLLPHGVAVFCASSGTGKSTIATGLARRGYALWADDAVAFELDARQAIAIPLPFAPRLRPDAADFLARIGPPHPVLCCLRDERAPIAYLCLLERVANQPATVEVKRLDPSSACKAALGHAYCFSVKDPVQKRRTVESYLALTARVPAYEVRFQPGLERLSTILDAVEGLMHSAPASAGS